MKEEYKDFIGIYDESVPVKLCNHFVKNYEEAKKNNTIIDLTKENESGFVERNNPHVRKDEHALVAPLFSTIYPKPPVIAYFDYLHKCFICYTKHYDVQFEGTIFNDVFKIHKVRKTEGFHQWHYENTSYESRDRFLVYQTYLQAPSEGGETEFLLQSKRIDPVVGRTLIWPAGFTHKHRGNPPLKREKIYLTGWFNMSPFSPQGG